jgi:hypothetical protein
MSFGKSKNSSDQTMDPEIKGILMDTFESGRELSQTPYNPYGGATVAPMSPFQQEGMQRTVDAARYGVGQDEMRDAIAATRSAAGYQPYNVNVGTVTAPGAYQPNTITAGTVTAPGAYQPTDITTGTITESTVNPEDVTAAQFTGQDMSQYMNPFETQAIDAAMGDIERTRLMQQESNDAQAVAGGAFGGDRHAILGAETNRAALDRAGNVASQMRSAGYDRGAQLAQSDVQRQMEALGMNQQADLQGQLANQRAGLDAATRTAEMALQGDIESGRSNLSSNLAANAAALDAARANQEASLRAATETGRSNLTSNLAANAANLEAGMGNQDAALRAALANQNAGLDAARLRLGAGNQLGALGGDLRGMTFGDAAAITGVGDLQRQFGQEYLDDEYRRFQMAQQYPFQMFDVLRSGAGMLPNPTLTSSRGRDTRLSFGG